MASRPLTIRNLVPKLVSVKSSQILHDRSDVGNHDGSQNLSGEISFNQAHENTQPYKVSKNERDVLIPPGGGLRIPFTNIIHFTLENDSQQYNLRIPNTSSHCRSVTVSSSSLDQDSQIFGIYQPLVHSLTFFYGSEYSAWMRHLRNDLPLSTLSIPGTHNSPAFHRALPSVRCQSVSITQQLRQGIRFLDIRVQPKYSSCHKGEDLLLVHGAFSVSLSRRSFLFRSLVQEVLLFLKENPSETVIMSLKREGTGASTDAQLSRILHDHYANDHHEWYTAPRVPFLGEARGKIVLMRRFNLDHCLEQEWGGTGWGIDASVWADNSPHSLCPSGQVCVQDYYSILNPKLITDKTAFAIAHLKRAAENDHRHDVCVSGNLMTLPFYINFLTASNLWRTGCWPEKIAAQLNPAILEYLCVTHQTETADGKVGSGSTGVVVCDFVGRHGNWDIVNCIIGMNFNFRKSDL